MTESFHTYVNCPHCGKPHTKESAFQRWVRDNGKPGRPLHSGEGFVVSDFDFVFHRFKTPQFDRRFQMLMFIEVKTHDRTISESQSKTLSIARQLISNQHGNFGNDSYARDGASGPWRRVRHYGGFELRFEHETPDDGWIKWHGKKIGREQLISLLRFEIDPWSLGKMDWRPNHHHPDKTIPLFST